MSWMSLKCIHSSVRRIIECLELERTSDTILLLPWAGLPTTRSAVGVASTCFLGEMLGREFVNALERDIL